MATKKSGGSSCNGRDSAGRRLGLKVGDGQYVLPGRILIRQRGTKWYPGYGTRLGKDHTVFALINGIVRFVRKTRRGRSDYVSVCVTAPTNVNTVNKKSEDTVYINN